MMNVSPLEKNGRNWHGYKLGKQALYTGTEIVNDALQEKHIKTAAKRRLGQAGQRMAERVLEGNRSRTKPLKRKASKKNTKSFGRGHESDFITKESSAKKSDLLLTNFPKSLKSKAKLLIDRISDHRQKEGDPVIDWNANGELLYQGETIHGSNLTDLILDVLHSRKDFNPIGWQQFIPYFLYIFSNSTSNL
ncbi:hypothetical protein HOLleu_01218 [Holothuria leucospilota]|uniref:Uncharacterized protein n=1 Tax=Holothuria leucospilota TaxID=206669 RepID=A0A9Q1CQQ3_HOLLE|nr:hypothetical protein HOLleu_01218 [Holothuria leucospilota]